MNNKLIKDLVYDERNNILVLVNYCNIKDNLYCDFCKVNNYNINNCCKNELRDEIIKYVCLNFQTQKINLKEANEMVSKDSKYFITGFSEKVKVPKKRMIKIIIDEKVMLEILNDSITYYSQKNNYKYEKILLLIKEYILCNKEEVIFYKKSFVKNKEEKKNGFFSQRNRQKSHFDYYPIKKQVFFYEPNFHIVNIKDISDTGLYPHTNKKQAKSHNSSVIYNQPKHLNIKQKELKKENEFLLETEENNPPPIKKRRKSVMDLFPLLVSGFTNNENKKLITHPKHLKFLNKLKDEKDKLSFISNKELFEKVNPEEVKKQQEKEEKYFNFLKRQKFKSLALAREGKINFLLYK